MRPTFLSPGANVKEVLAPPSGDGNQPVVGLTSGHCPACGARRHLDRGADHVAAATFHHEDDCPACDDNLFAALDSEGFHL